MKKLVEQDVKEKKEKKMEKEMLPTVKRTGSNLRKRNKTKKSAQTKRLRQCKEKKRKKRIEIIMHCIFGFLRIVFSIQASEASWGEDQPKTSFGFHLQSSERHACTCTR